MIDFIKNIDPVIQYYIFISLFAIFLTNGLIYLKKIADKRFGE